MAWALLLLSTVLPAGRPGAAPAVPAPEAVLGFPPCADYRLATSEQIADYFRRLAAASPRMRLFEIGRTAGGRTQLLAAISSEANLRNLARHQRTARRLALARGLTDESARALAAEGRAVVWIDFGLHSSEVAHAQTAPLMAHRAATDESAELRFIRDEVIFLLMPDMNPDGTTLVADWYMRHVGTPYEASAPPELYHRYAGHDNNRDWFMFNLPESRNVARQLYAEWFPQIVHNHHQTAPFPARIFVPPFADPMNPNIPPLVMRGVHAVGSAIARRLEREGRTGVISRIQFDTWWNGGMRTAPYFHNMIGILTETAHASATPATYDPATFPPAFSNGVPTLEPSTFYPSPYRGGHWRLRDSCDYMTTASLAVLDIGARQRQGWLYDIYQMGRDAIRAGADELYVVPAAQWDPGTAVRMINTLRRGGIEVWRARSGFSAGGESYGAGSFVIPGAQPFRPYLTDLLHPQVYPDRRPSAGASPPAVYDITGWTLPYQMGVRVDRLEGPLPAVVLDPVASAAPPRGSVASRARFAYAIDPRANDAFIAVNRLLAAGDLVYRVAQPVRRTSSAWPAGAFLVRPGPGTRARLDRLAGTLGLDVAAVDDTPDGLLRLRAPRIGLYRAWGGNMDEGWTRWLLEQFEFPHATLRDAAIRAGGLRADYDAIVLPRASSDRMLDGLVPGRMPAEYTGGMTAQGVANLQAFVAAGGTLIALDAAAALPIASFGLPLRDVTADRPEGELHIPGSLLRIHVDPRHPVGFGLPGETAAFFGRSPAFWPTEPAGTRPGSSRPEQVGSGRVRIVARYAGKDLLMSGLAVGADAIAGRAAVVEAEVGDGRVVLIGVRAQHRGQPHATFKLLFNALYLSSMAAAD